ncbi:MAG: hypothetical protein CMQ20_14530 [Gammaproteobacteria bacterium]|jgi:hypothetical protein|nr:hypothetical protein [Gammaproteobacteria bacterium]|tara:strand:- start:340 stop:879 length:540 start_codon:yes stop_codon:yes gene_type:complete
MTKKQRQGQTITQNAHVVVDIHEAMERWMKVMGIGPFFFMEKIELVDIIYRSEPSHLEVVAALAFAGDLQIELIEQKSTEQSIYRDVVPEGKEGFHHINIYPDDFESEIERYTNLGYPIAMTGKVAGSGMRFCFIDTRSVYNCMLELVDNVAGSEMWAAHRQISNEWDGVTDPVRPISL